MTDDDVTDIFQNVGHVQVAVVHYDREGHSLGTAEVTFTNKRDALKAVDEYDGVQIHFLKR